MIPSLVLWVKGSAVATDAVYVEAEAQIQSLAQEHPCATDVAIKKQKEKLLGGSGNDW